MTTNAQTKKAPTAKTPVKASAKTGGKTLIVTQIGSRFGGKPGVIETLTGLGLGKIRATRELQDTPEVRGMLTRVKHLVKVEEKRG
jgi:large subunit ribosomal protein L30